ncbi:glycosyltransferase [Paramaledivibacter caminithermalis]|jgi:GT2 family glycosyltransferase|uniref:Glycosyl transferase family 2 n=1 Tax=Paramaledivibacter caminithermalis (strain DSM 15212 / CIP 107654 / DViRD3) TaxID=1121301 RepID=A0A1M6QZS5_PARC5|nr:glycosyltransferase [Paramaledivibacter caminithermalis]SHK25779.1 Glycosyl transferase family 2 [Paramaledivibacter caminithermalis DSM 15212]
MISIVIRVKDDEKIFKCINSIDYDNCEIVIVCNGSSDDFVERLHKINKNNLRIFRLKEASLTKSYNKGIMQSSYSKVLLMDSDCTFRRNVIERFDKNLDKYEIVKGIISFQYNNILEKIVAKSREIHINKRNAYAPPLGFNKRIIDKIEYYFDERLSATEDYDLDVRIRKKGMKIFFDKKAVINHAALSLKADLKSSYNYGFGHADGVRLEKSGYYPIEISLISDFRKIYKFTKDLLLSLYLIIWLIFFKKGYDDNSKHQERRLN